MARDAEQSLREERDRLAVRLRHAEEELSLVSDSVPAAIGYLDANEGYRFVNRVFAGWLGRAPASLVGLHVSEVLGEEAYRVLRPHLLRALAGATVTFTAHVPYPTGARWIEATYVPHYGDAVATVGVVVMALDVTQRRHEEEERADLLARLKRSEARLRRFHDSAVIGIVQFARGGAILDANDAFLRMLGYTREEVARGAASWQSLTPPSWKHLDEQAFRELDERGTCTPYEKEYVHKDGHRVPIQLGIAFLDGSTSEGVAWVLDVTARKRGEERQAVLIEVGGRLASTLEPDAILRDVVELLVRRFASGAVIELFGDGESVVEHVASGGRTGRAVAAPLVARGRTLGRIEVSPSGRPFDEADAELVQELGRRIGIAVDNARLFDAARTERRRAEEASRAKDEFLAMVSHELRTPLNAMLGWATLLRAGSLPPERREHALAIIERNVRAQAQLVEDLLDISRVITGKLRLDVREVDLPAVVRDAIEAMRPAAESKGVRLLRGVDEDAGAISGDPDRLRQVVYNLVANAVRHTPREGTVTIELSRQESQVRIVVTDTGEGIAKELLAHVFDRFRQGEGGTTRRYGGLGLGLAIVKHIVELHGGTVRGESEGVGRGAAFTVELPLGAPPETARAARASGGALGALGRVERRAELAGLEVLVVEDDDDARELVQALLEASGAIVRTAKSASEALARFDERPPHVLLSDIGMPHEDGYALIEEVRRRPADRGGRVPAVALTAFARLEDRTRALLAGYSMHVAKPVEAAELLVVLAAVSGRLVTS